MVALNLKPGKRHSIELLIPKLVARQSAPCQCPRGRACEIQMMDRVAWDYLFNTYKHIGFGNKLMKWISSLYNDPCVKIKINDTYSKPIKIRNGTRQGCPFSPLLFILTLGL